MRTPMHPERLTQRNLTDILRSLGRRPSRAHVVRLQHLFRQSGSGLTDALLNDALRVRTFLITDPDLSTLYNE